MTFRIEHKDNLGRTVGYAGFTDYARASAHIFDVLNYARNSRFCQIKTVAIYKDGQFKAVRTV